MAGRAGFISASTAPRSTPSKRREPRGHSPGASSGVPPEKKLAVGAVRGEPVFGVDSLIQRQSAGKSPNTILLLERLIQVGDTIYMGN
jgi:hypothetical protein